MINFRCSITGAQRFKHQNQKSWRHVCDSLCCCTSEHQREKVSSFIQRFHPLPKKKKDHCSSLNYRFALKASSLLKVAANLITKRKPTEKSSQALSSSIMNIQHLLFLIPRFRMDDPCNRHIRDGRQKRQDIFIWEGPLWNPWRPPNVCGGIRAERSRGGWFYSSSGCRSSKAACSMSSSNPT